MCACALCAERNGTPQGKYTIIQNKKTRYMGHAQGGAGRSGGIGCLCLTLMRAAEGLKKTRRKNYFRSTVQLCWESPSLTMDNPLFALALCNIVAAAVFVFGVERYGGGSWHCGRLPKEAKGRGEPQKKSKNKTKQNREKRAVR